MACQVFRHGGTGFLLLGPIESCLTLARWQHVALEGEELAFRIARTLGEGGEQLRHRPVTHFFHRVAYDL